MEKLILNKNIIEEVDYTWIDNGFHEYHNHRDCLGQYFTSNKLDEAVLDYIYGVLLTVPTKNVHSALVDVSGTIREYISDIEALSKHDAGSKASASGRIEFIFSNVDKRLPLPLLLVKSVLRCADNVDIDLGVSLGRALVMAYGDDEVVKANPKNIMKICGFPERDAKALYQNIKNIDAEIFLAKGNKISKDINHMAVYLQHSPPSHSWNVSSLIDPDSNNPSSEIVDLIKLVMEETALPITNLAIWRSITKKWYQLEKGDTWSNLTLIAQQRHIVNMIRHNSIGYTQAYRDVPKELVDELHDLAFDAIMRKIANTFPFLHSECQRQWAYRDDHDAQWQDLAD